MAKRSQTIPQDARVLINGVGQPIGDAIVRRFAAAGARIATTCLATDEEEATRTAEQADVAFAAVCDPSDPTAVKATVRAATAALGGLDVLVNATSLRRNGPCHELSIEDWRQVVGVELSGTLYFCRESIRPMMRQRRGWMINLTDVAGLRGEANGVNHSAARGGIAALTRALASELAPRGIFVNAMAVSYLENELQDLAPESQSRLLNNTPMGRAGKSEEVAEAAYFLASGAASFTTGHLLQVNGGLYL